MQSAGVAVLFPLISILVIVMGSALKSGANETSGTERVETVTIASLFEPIHQQQDGKGPSGFLLRNHSNEFIDLLDVQRASQTASRKSSGAVQTPQVASLLEEQSGDPALNLESLSIDQVTNQGIQDLLSMPSRGPKVPRPQLALQTLRVAKTHIGNSRKDPAKMVKLYLALYGLPFKYSDDRYVPYCAAGLGFVACQAYREITKQNVDLDTPDIALIFRDSLTDVKRDLAATHPSCVEMIKSARLNGTWQLPKNANGTRTMPKPGWLVFYNWNGGSAPQHVGIVDRAEPGQLHTVEFNTSNSDFSNGGAVLARIRKYRFVIGYIDTYKEPGIH